jgi:hypothetical protein
MQQEKGIMNRIVEAGRSEEVWRLNESGKRKKKTARPWECGQDVGGKD